MFIFSHAGVMSLQKISVLNRTSVLCEIFCVNDKKVWHFPQCHCATSLFFKGYIMSSWYSQPQTYSLMTTHQQQYRHFLYSWTLRGAATMLGYGCPNTLGCRNMWLTCVIVDNLIKYPSNSQCTEPTTKLQLPAALRVYASNSVKMCDSNKSISRRGSSV